MLSVVNKNLVTVFLGMCLLLFLTAGIFFRASAVTLFECTYLLIMAFLILAGSDYKERIGLLFLTVSVSAGYLLFFDNHFLLLGGELAGVGILFWQNRKHESYFPFLIILIAFVLHLYYIQSIEIEYHQHDFGGILYYIRQILWGTDGLFRMNPWQMYYLFHQPLHFIISGQVYLAGLYLFGENGAAFAGLQYVSLFYVTLSCVFAVRILKGFKLPAKVFYVAVLLFCFNPTLFLFSGYISDDTPALFWGILFIYNFLIWYKDEAVKRLIYAALCFGFGVLTKLSVLIMVPAISFLFLYKLAKSWDKKKILSQICLFIIVAVPLALVWIVRNHVLFDMPFYHIPDTSPMGQNFKYLTFRERIGDFSQIFMPFINAPYMTESNMWLALVKTELFGEWDLSLMRPQVFVPAFSLYMVAILFKLAALVCAFVLLRKKNFSAITTFFVLIYFCLLGYSFKYAIDYPYACSTDYRLFSGLMLAEIAITAFVIQKNRRLALCYLTGSIVYAVLSVVIYIMSV